MLEKTLAMLADVKPGTWLPDDVMSFDPAELDELGRVLDRLVYGPSSLRRRAAAKIRRNDHPRGRVWRNPDGRGTGAVVRLSLFADPGRDLSRQR